MVLIRSIKNILSKYLKKSDLKFNPKSEAKIVLLRSNKEIIVKKKTALHDAIDDVYFSCRKGYCNVCIVDVEEGMENLSKRTYNECPSGPRLMCQCRINGGIVKLDL